MKPKDKYEGFYHHQEVKDKEFHPEDHREAQHHSIDDEEYSMHLYNP